MFCKKCGKELQDTDVICRFCGEKCDNGSTQNSSNSINLTLDVTSYLKNNAKGFLKLLCLFSSVMAIWLRFYYNEIETHYGFLTEDDYYAMGEKGISYIAILAIVHFALCIFSIKTHNKYNPDKKKKFIWAFLPIVLCVLMTITIPAPY